MSFLQNLQTRKTALKRTETLVTCVDGTRYIEKHSSCTNIDEIVPLEATTGFVIDTAPDAIPAMVVPNLYVGSQDCCAPDVLFAYGIKVVLSVGIESPHKVPAVMYTHVECLDLPETKLSHVITRCNAVITSAMNECNNILVHCNAGVSRSAAVIIGYLMLEMKMPYNDAYQLLKSVRSCVQPNPGFVKQLKNM
ncbi:MAP kinase-specific phosphatase [Carabus blaptoides fortunei]